MAKNYSIGNTEQTLVKVATEDKDYGFGFGVKDTGIGTFANAGDPGGGTGGSKPPTSCINKTQIKTACSMCMGPGSAGTQVVKSLRSLYSSN